MDDCVERLGREGHGHRGLDILGRVHRDLVQVLGVDHLSVVRRGTRADGDHGLAELLRGGHPGEDHLEWED